LKHNWIVASRCPGHSPTDPHRHSGNPADPWSSSDHPRINRRNQISPTSGTFPWIVCPSASERRSSPSRNQETKTHILAKISLRPIEHGPSRDIEGSWKVFNMRFSRLIRNRN
jgi:hypothetical protein